MLSLPPHSPLAVPVEVTASQDEDLVSMDRPLGTSLQAGPLRRAGPSMVGDTMPQAQYPSHTHSFIMGCELHADRTAMTGEWEVPGTSGLNPKGLLSMSTS